MAKRKPQKATDDQPKAYRAKLSDFQQLGRNPNAHTERGQYMLEEGMKEVGYLDSMVASADNVLLSGNLRSEVAYEKFGDEVIVIETDGTIPIIHKRVDVASESDTAKHAVITANRVSEVSYEPDLEVLAEYGEDIDLKKWYFDYELEALLGEETELDLGLGGESEGGGESGEDEADPVHPSDVGDFRYPSDNEWDVPVLLANLQAGALELPVNRWGTEARSKRIKGMLHFYTDDYRFEGVWKDPTTVVNGGCKTVVEPNFSTNDMMPKTVVLWHIYRKRWLARFWQSYGVRIFVDLAIAPKFRDIALLGVPKGWKSYATYTYTRDYPLDWILADHAQAVEHAGTDDILFYVYGGDQSIEKLCRDRGWLWSPAHQQAYFKSVKPWKGG